MGIYNYKQTTFRQIFYMIMDRNEAIDIVKKNWSYDKHQLYEALEILIPELKESEDDRIRKQILDCFRTMKQQGCFPSKHKEQYDSWIAWLEKQGKKPQGKTVLEAINEVKVDNQNCVKNNDKVEPKFKIGNWYQCIKDFFGKGVTFDKNTAYYCAKEGCLQDEYGCHIAIIKDLYDNFKLWTIQDAKDGDVLTTDMVHFIFKSKDDIGCYMYCHYSVVSNKFSTSDTATVNSEYVHPATQEQRDVLFQKMNEAGYELDAEKKESNEIEPKPIQETEPFEVEHGKYYYCIKDYFCGGKKQASKGDVVQALRGLPIMGLKDASEYFLPVNFIKCNSTWSKEDEIALGDALWCCEQAASIAKDENDMGNIWYAENWLKSLKDRCIWKPSDEQMEQLGCIAEQNKDNMIGKDFITLYNDLKKVK